MISSNQLKFFDQEGYLELEKILSEQEQLATLKRKLLMRPKTLERISNLEANIEAQRERKLKLGDQLPTKEDIARLIDQLYEKATRSNLKITRFERGDRTDEELFTRIEIEMEFYATFQNVLHFFAELHDFFDVFQSGVVLLRI